MDVREKLVELLTNSPQLDVLDWTTGWEEAANYLIAHGVTVQEWIPVTERLPEENEIVVGWCKDNPFSSYTFEIVSWNGKGWVFVYAQRYVTNVTNWMPLPQPPKGE